MEDSGANMGCAVCAASIGTPSGGSTKTTTKTIVGHSHQCFKAVVLLAHDCALNMLFKIFKKRKAWPLAVDVTTSDVSEHPFGSSQSGSSLSLIDVVGHLFEAGWKGQKSYQVL